NGATNIAKLAGSTHIATHVDAPRHVDAKGATVDQLPIDPFIGRATVIEILDTPRIDESILK
ncbi:cyclase family protein, partial [Pseudomonas aeruginosa]